MKILNKLIKQTLRKVKKLLSIIHFRTAARVTPLMVKARKNILIANDNLLKDYEEINAKDSYGRTALHYSMKYHNSKFAACLLASGADFTLADNYGKLPLSPGFTSLKNIHAVRQLHRRFHEYKPLPNTITSQETLGRANRLAHSGIIRITGLISTDVLIQLRSEFEGFINSIDTKMANNEGLFKHYDEEEHYWPNDNAYVSNNAFKNSPTLAKVCSHSKLIELANYFYGRRAYISRGVAMRYHASKKTDNDMFGWHHDMEDKRFKMMILLTDISEDEQCMSYLLGSHKLFHPYNMFFSNPCSIDYCRPQLDKIEVYKTIGHAGDIFIFDTNGAHRGNRNHQAGIRDAYFIEYDPDLCNVWGGDVPSSFTNLEGPHDNPFERMANKTKKWEIPFRRANPDWIENLPYVERWLS